MHPPLWCWWRWCFQPRCWCRSQITLPMCETWAPKISQNHSSSEGHSSECFVLYMYPSASCYNLDDLYPFTCRSHANQPGQHLKILCFPAEVAKLGPEVAANSLPCNALTDCTLLLWAAFWVWGSWGHVEIVWIRTGGPLICMWYESRYDMFIIVWEHVWYCIHFTGTKNLALALEFGSSLYISTYFDMDTNPKLKKTRTIAGWCGLWHHFQGWLNTPFESPTVRVVDEGLLNADVSEPDVCFGGCISVIGRSYQILVVPFCLSNASMMPWRQGWSLVVTERFSVWRRGNQFALARLLCQGCQQWLFDANDRSRKVSHAHE